LAGLSVGGAGARRNGFKFWRRHLRPARSWRRKLCQPVAETGTSLPAEAGFAEAVVVDDQRADQALSQPAIVIDLARVGRVNIFASAPPALAAAVLKAVMR
jgi:transposase